LGEGRRGRFGKDGVEVTGIAMALTGQHIMEVT
jgi:hypothetical protein